MSWAVVSESTDHLGYRLLVEKDLSIEGESWKWSVHSRPGAGKHGWADGQTGSRTTAMTAAVETAKCLAKHSP